MDIVVTTPGWARADAAREAEDVQEAQGGMYFRRLPTRPKELTVGDRVFYVEAGYLRGFARCAAIRFETGQRCDTTDIQWPKGVYVWMEAESWTWIKPVPFQGFQGWRYLAFEESEIEIVGGWLDAMPEIEEN